MPQIRLLARCQMHGGIQEPGYTFDMPEFETEDARAEYLRSLPHSVSDHGNPAAANYRADLHGTSIDAVTGGAYVGPIQQPIRDVPLYIIIDGDPPADAAPVPALPPDPAMVILPSGPVDPKPPAEPIVADHVTGALETPAAAGEPAPGQAELTEQESPVELEDGPAAEGEHDDDDAGEAPKV